MKEISIIMEIDGEQITWDDKVDDFSADIGEVLDHAVEAVMKYIREIENKQRATCETHHVHNCVRC